MISDKKGNSWAIEPGRGVIYSPADKEPYFLMTNFSLCDFKSGINLTDCGYDRYINAQTLLNTASTLDVAAAFKILEATRQVGEWNTEFSMVYSQKENAVYYCLNGDFNDIVKRSFEVECGASKTESISTSNKEIKSKAAAGLALK